ncbi:MAG: phosphoribosylformylglycinamidine cyclo-ligase [Candidatus Aenigmarchaeota archaeon]|nr:phosphoribosylformylglycinamidine cyclo-ligase [Candidatus Aenigmarchaeota archaeon]
MTEGIKDSVYMKPVTYADSGVDIKKEDAAVRSIVSVISGTFANRKGKIGEVKSRIGHFANFIDIGDKYIVMCTDGVGTKVLIAQMARKFDTVGIDMMAMNVNDIICTGAEPIALVDYLAVEKIDNDMVLELSKGIRDGANDAGVAVIGGETASLKGVITGVGGMGFDLAGTSIGVVDKDKVVLGDNIQAGDKVIGIASSGLHSNGYSLARKVVLGKYKLEDKFPWGVSVADELLRPTKIYVKPVLDVLSKYRGSVTGLCHITGGGLMNLKRLNGNAGFRLSDLMDALPIFSEIKKVADIADEEMYKTFNMGMGFVVVCREESARGVMNILEKHDLACKVVGEVTGDKGVVEVPKLNLKF